MKRGVAFSLLAGIVWGLGFQIKVTIGISLIALLVVLATKSNLKYYWKHAALTLMATILTVGAIYGGLKTLPCEKDIYQYSDPILLSVALGLGESGNYADNEEFDILCRQVGNIDARREIVMEKLKTDWRLFFNPDHLVKKARMNFASGDFGIAKYLDYPYEEDNLIWQLMSYNGPYFWKYACASTSYLFAIYILVSFGVVRMFLRKDSDMILEVCFITLFGLVLFLMLWEAQHKQLFNHMGWFVIAAAYGLNRIQIQHEQSQKTRKEENHGRDKEDASP